MAVKEFFIWLHGDNEHNVDVLQEQGFSEEEIEYLASACYEVKVVGIYDTDTHKYAIKEWIEI